MKKYIIFLFVIFTYYSSYSQVNTSSKNESDTLLSYLSKTLNKNVVFYSLCGYPTEKIDSVRYEIPIIVTYNNITNKYTTYRNESLDSLFESSKIKYPFNIPYVFAFQKKISILECSKRTHVSTLFPSF
jgi:hypothetical protein